MCSQPGNIECVATGSDNVFFGSSDGVVRILSQSFKIVRLFKAHETGAITFMKQVQGTSLLVTIAEDMPHETVLKVWALDKLEKKTGIPRCVSTLSINNGRKPFPVSSTRHVNQVAPLRLTDFCLYCSRRLVAISDRFRKWIGNRSSW